MSLYGYFSRPCPTCGACPTCGRPGAYTGPWSPNYWWQQYPAYPWQITTVGGILAGTNVSTPDTRDYTQVSCVN